MKLSIVYLTCRANPRFDWFCDSLFRQLPASHIPYTELIVIDSVLWKEDVPARRQLVREAVKDRISMSHIPPKPSPYQGPERQTSGEYFSAASARNTGLAAARGAYIVFVDDVSVLMPGWYSRVNIAAQEGYVVAGSYHKHFEMVVQDGILLSSRHDTAGIDSRWNHGSDEAAVPMGGGWLYGASFGAPVETLLAVNGLDELCDTIGGEDYQLGLRLERSGAQLTYDRRMWTVESEELHNQPYVMQRIIRSLDESRYMEKLGQYGVTSRATSGATDASYMILDILYGRDDTWTALNRYDLRDVRRSGTFPSLSGMSDTYWFDDTLLSEL